jgi:hypothetical protein
MPKKQVDCKQALKDSTALPNVIYATRLASGYHIISL